MARVGGTPVAVTSQYQDLPLPRGLRQPIGLLSLGELEICRLYELTFPGLTTQPSQLRFETLPDLIPADGLVLLLASCYCRGLDDGRLARAVLNLPAHLQPVFKLLVGDQLYTDVPGFGPGNGTGAEQEHAQRYLDYWTSPEYQLFLAHSPNFFSCDDHEFWNNYPEWQPHIRRTYPDVRDQCQRAALRLYDLFQGVGNPGQSRWYTFTIDPVSFFVADTRSEREPSHPGARLISPQQEMALRNWATHLSGPGILAIGQPLLDRLGDWTDRALVDYPGHYALLWELIEGAPHQILILSGDIHIGRYASVPERPAVPHRPRIAEFVTSPTSLVPVPLLGQRRASVAVPSRVHPGGESSPESRDVLLQFGTHLDNFGIIQLKSLGFDRPRVRVTLQLWDSGVSSS
jgi:PhoD-like phosphatase